jgi:hypothetical protein
MVIYHTSEFSTFSIQAGTSLAIAELSLLHDISIYELPAGVWYFFNRLNVPRGFPIQHASVLLMKEICSWADDQHINIVDTLNPYGRLNFEQLRRFNLLFGFRNVDGQHHSFMTRHCRR